MIYRFHIFIFNKAFKYIRIIMIKFCFLFNINISVWWNICSGISLSSVFRSQILWRKTGYIYESNKEMLLIGLKRSRPLTRL